MADVPGISRNRTLKEGLNFLDLRTKIVQFLTNLRKFAADTTVFGSLKAAGGRNQGHKIEKKGFDDEKPEELKLVMDKLQQVKMEESEEHKKKTRQCHSLPSVKSVFDDSEPLKKSPGEERFRKLDVTQNQKKRIFIRSRL